MKTLERARREMITSDCGRVIKNRVVVNFNIL